MVSVYGAEGTLKTEQLLWAKMENTIALPEGEMIADNMENRATMSRIKGLGLNLAALPWDILYQLQDGATKEL